MSGTISIVLVSKGRPEILDDTLDSIFRQTLSPEQVVVVVPSAQDLPRRARAETILTLVGPLGTTVQRNRGIEAVPLSIDYVGFFDDDFELRRDYLEQAVAFLDARPDVVGLSSSRLLAEGGVTREQARELVARHVTPAGGPVNFQYEGDGHCLHGCNMVIRRALLERERFDENLPLYGFAEDYEISMRLERHGKAGKLDRCAGVHLCSGAGRIREVQHGYSLIANQWYCLRKGSVHTTPFRATVWFWQVVVGRMFLRTLRGCLTRDGACDWRGRMKGILLALKDIALGCCEPKRMLDL